ncbi:MAG: hypothetical protein HY651_13130 [Acidobacteria bacterium]|nr:hypothetical protein [Acidobacteriota bacterium]
MLENQGNQARELQGKPFQCPLCGTELPIEITQKQKPYCVCNTCGIQIFFRGKLGIKRLQIMLESLDPVSQDFSGATVVVSFYNRLEQLRRQRNELDAKQGIIFRNHTLDDAMETLDGEIQRIESVIRKARKNAEREK